MKEKSYLHVRSGTHGVYYYYPFVFLYPHILYYSSLVHSFSRSVEFHFMYGAHLSPEIPVILGNPLGVKKANFPSVQKLNIEFVF